LIGKIHRCSADPSDFTDTDIWLLSGPTCYNVEILLKIAPFVKPDSYVGSIFAQGGFDWIMAEVFKKNLADKNITVFGFFNVPYICKIIEYGSKVHILGAKKYIYCAVSNHKLKSCADD